MTLATVCTIPRCPRPVVGQRGRCAVHGQTMEQRGYGAAHKADRAANRRGAVCSSCGCTRNLQRDHVIPKSLGGTDDPANKRWLCACAEHGCHTRVGVRLSSRVRR